MSLLILLASACGVKGPPQAPKGTEIPSWEDQFIQKKNLIKKQEKKKAN